MRGPNRLARRTLQALALAVVVALAAALPLKPANAGGYRGSFFFYGSVPGYYPGYAYAPAYYPQPYYYAPPPVYYAPPPAYYAPPPAYYAPPSISFGVAIPFGHYGRY